MVLFNLCGGPGAGKTTTSWYLGYRLRKEGHKVELVGEASREHHIYDATPGTVAPPLIDNQILLAGQQYERTLRLKRHGFEVAISDSPIIQGLLYCEGQKYYDNLKAAIRDIEGEFETYNIMIHPDPGVYDKEARAQTAEEARAMDTICRELIGHFWLEINWNEEGFLAEKAIQLLKKGKD